MLTRVKTNSKVTNSLFINYFSNSFQVLAGSGLKQLLNQPIFQNPLCALMVGILVTVLVQSQSTSISIFISMVGAGILPLEESIYMIFGKKIIFYLNLIFRKNSFIFLN